MELTSRGERRLMQQEYGRVEFSSKRGELLFHAVSVLYSVMHPMMTISGGSGGDGRSKKSRSVFLLELVTVT